MLEARPSMNTDYSSYYSPFNLLIVLSHTGHSLVSSVPSSNVINITFEFKHISHINFYVNCCTPQGLREALTPGKTFYCIFLKESIAFKDLRERHTKEVISKTTFLTLSVIVPKAFGIRNPSASPLGRGVGGGYS